MSLLPCLLPAVDRVTGAPPGRFGDPLLDAYLEFLVARVRPNSVLAAWYDLKVYFNVVGKPVVAETPTDVFGFITAQRTGSASLPAGGVMSAPTGPAGVSLRTLHRRLSTISGLYTFLAARGDVPASPVPRGLPTRRERNRLRQGVPLVRAPRTLPRILTPAEVDALTAALRTHRDRAMVAAMLLGGLRRCEVLGLRLADLQVAQRRVFIADGKGGHQRLVPIADRFFTQGGCPRCYPARRLAWMGSWRSPGPSSRGAGRALRRDRRPGRRGVALDPRRGHRGLDAVPPGHQAGPGRDGRRRGAAGLHRCRDPRRPGGLPPVRPGPPRVVQRPPPTRARRDRRAHRPSVAHPAG